MTAAADAKKAIALEVDAIHVDAKGHARSAGRARSFWKFLARADDVVTILLAALAAANAAAFLGPWFTAVTGGLAALASLFAITVHPERLAARCAFHERRWLGLRDDAANKSTGVGGLSVGDAKGVLDELTERREEIRTEAAPAPAPQDW